MRRSFFISIQILFVGILAAQDLQFYREDILLTVDTGTYTFKGDYYFRNPSNRKIRKLIYYPVSSLYSKKPFDTLLVFDSPDLTKPLETVIRDTMASFYVTIPAESQKVVQVFYRQHHNGKKIRYLITSSRNWQSPIQKASYSLVINKKLKVSGFSYTPENSEDFGDSHIYYWKLENFMPDREFEVTFSP